MGIFLWRTVNFPQTDSIGANVLYAHFFSSVMVKGCNAVLQTLCLSEKERREYAFWLVDNKAATTASQLLYYLGGSQKTWRKFFQTYAAGGYDNLRGLWKPSEEQLLAVPAAATAAPADPSPSSPSCFGPRHLDWFGEDSLLSFSHQPSAMLASLGLGCAFVPCCACFWFLSSLFFPLFFR